MLLFVVSTLVVFHFVLPTGSSDLAATGLLWVALLFTALLGLSRSFAAEREQGLIDGLVLAPSDRSAIWLGKAVSVLAFLALAEVLALPAYGRSSGLSTQRSWRGGRSGVAASPPGGPPSPPRAPPGAPARWC